MKKHLAQRRKTAKKKTSPHSSWTVILSLWGCDFILVEMHMPFKIAPRMLTFLEKHAGDPESTGICNVEKICNLWVMYIICNCLWTYNNANIFDWSNNLREKHLPTLDLNVAIIWQLTEGSTRWMGTSCPRNDLENKKWWWRWHLRNPPQEHAPLFGDWSV